MRKRRINNKRGHLDKVAEEALEKWLEGHDVIIRFQRIVDRNRVESMVDLFVGNSGMHLVDRHMELERYLVKAW